MVKIKSRVQTNLWKHLHLIVPWYAEELLGEPVEGPVFVSPLVQTKQRCDICGIEYGPLVYKLGERTVAHHLHANFIGGIYTTTGAPDTYHWLTQGTGDDVFERDGVIKCRSFLPLIQPHPPKGANVLIEGHTGIIEPTYSAKRAGDSLNQVGEVDDEGNMRFTMETWEKWRECSQLSRINN